MSCCAGEEHSDCLVKSRLIAGGQTSTSSTLKPAAQDSFLSVRITLTLTEKLTNVQQALEARFSMAASWTTMSKKAKDAERRSSEEGETQWMLRASCEVSSIFPEEEDHEISAVELQG